MRSPREKARPSNRRDVHREAWTFVSTRHRVQRGHAGGNAAIKFRDETIVERQSFGSLKRAITERARIGG